MKATLRLPSDVPVIEAALEGLVLANVVQMEQGLVVSSPLDPRAHVRYQREPSGYEDWNLASIMQRLRYGDCEDIAAWEAAGFRYRGDDDGARVMLYRTGPRLYHAVCELSSGEIVDSCPALGMKVRRGHRVSPSSSTKSPRDPDSLPPFNADDER